MKKSVYATKPIDILYFLLLVVIIAIGFHALVSLKGGKHDDRTFTERMDDFYSIGRFLFAFVMVLIFFSPVWVFRRKYPKRLEINFEDNTITIVQRNKKRPLVLEKSNLSYFILHYGLYSKMEIYYEFLSSRGVPLKKRVINLMAPISIFSFNQSTLRKIEKDLKTLGLDTVENKWRPTNEHPILD